MTSPLVDKTSGVPKWGREKVVTNPLISYRTAIAIRSNGSRDDFTQGRMETDRLECFKNDE